MKSWLAVTENDNNCHQNTAKMTEKMPYNRLA
jgi:hypothetical protein